MAKEHGERIASLETEVDIMKGEIKVLRDVRHEHANMLQRHSGIFDRMEETVQHLQIASQGLADSVNKLVNIKYMVIGGFVVGKATIVAFGGKILGWW